MWKHSQMEISGAMCSCDLFLDWDQEGSKGRPFMVCTAHKNLRIVHVSGKDITKHVNCTNKRIVIAMLTQKAQDEMKEVYQ